MLRIAFLILFSIYIFNCDVKPVPAWDAQSQINAAAEFKANQCLRDCQTAQLAQQDPSKRTSCIRMLPFPPLLVLHDQDQRNLNLCSIAITRTSCPLSAYPLACLVVYVKKPVGDIPPYINFNEFSKQKFR